MRAKILIWLLATFLLITVSPAEAQQAKKVPVIGTLHSDSPSSVVELSFEAFRQGLRQLGYVVGQNILIEYRFAEGKRDRVPDLAAELVRLKVDVIFAVGGGPVTAVKRATSTIPIVASAGDLVGGGIVASLARPGGNITGVTNVDSDFSAKRLLLLKDSFPKLSRVAFLSEGRRGDSAELKETRAAAQSLKVRIQSLEVTDPSQFQAAFSAMTKERAEAIIIANNSFTFFHRGQLFELASKNRLPTMCGRAGFADAGGLMSYAADRLDSFRRAAIFVDKILKGRTPADLPVEQPMKFEFVINLKTAKQIGVTIPQSVLYRADKVIK